MFYARFIQCFNIKYLQFLLLIFSFFSIHPNPLESDVDIKNRRSILARDLEKNKFERLLRKHSKSDNSYQVKYHAIIHRCIDAIKEKQSSLSFDCVSKESMNRITKKANAFQQKLSHYLRNNCYQQDEEYLPLLLTEASEYQDEDTMQEADALDYNLLHPKPLQVVCEGLLIGAALSSGGSVAATGSVAGLTASGSSFAAFLAASGSAPIVLGAGTGTGIVLGAGATTIATTAAVTTAATTTTAATVSLGTVVATGIGIGSLAVLVHAHRAAETVAVSASIQSVMTPAPVAIAVPIVTAQTIQLIDQDVYALLAAQVVTPIVVNLVADIGSVICSIATPGVASFLTIMATDHISRHFQSEFFQNRSEQDARLFELAVQALEKAKQYLNCYGDMSHEDIAKQKEKDVKNLQNALYASGCLTLAPALVEKCAQEALQGGKNISREDKIREFNDKLGMYQTLKNAGITFTDNTSSAITYGYNGDDAVTVLTVQDSYGNRLKYWSKDGSTPALIDETIVHQQAYRQMVSYGSPKSIEQQHADAQKQKKLDKSRAQAQVKYEKQQVAQAKKTVEASNAPASCAQAIDTLLPSSQFKPVYASDGTITKNKDGYPIDTYGNIWQWKKSDQKWHVHQPGTKTGYAIDPKKSSRYFDHADAQKQYLENKSRPDVTVCVDQPADKSGQQGCGNWHDAENQPKILTTPQDQPEKVVAPGCGQTSPVDRPADTAHTADPALAADRSGGCSGLQIPALDEQRPTAWHAQIGDLSNADVTFREDNIKHIFRAEEGHLTITTENRERIINLVKNPKNYLGPDQHMNSWYGHILPDGTQLWAQTRGAKITNCGLNDVPIEYNPKTGLSALQAPPNNNKKD